jgi:DNA replication protein DnaC
MKATMSFWKMPNGKIYIACALGNAVCCRFKKVRYICMPELPDELTTVRSSDELKNAGFIKDINGFYVKSKY